MTDDAAIRWLIVCDCAGHPEELIGEVDVDAAGQARIWNTGRGDASPSLQGATRMLFDAHISERKELLRKLKTREIPLRATATFSHSPCGLSLRVNEDGLAELLGVVSSAVPDQRVSLSLLCAVNGKLQRGATR